MADVLIKIRGDASDLEDAISDAKSSVNSFSDGLKTFGKTAAAGVVAGGAAIGGALIGVGAVSINMATQIRQSQNDIQASLGVTKARAEELSQVATDVFAQGFGDSLEQATSTLIEASRQLGDIGNEGLQAATESAIKLSDVFSADLTQSLNGAGTIMKEFGLNQQQAFDLMTSGFQQGLNNSGDFLDSIREYSNVFADAGFSAAEMFSIMQSGAAGGVLGTDKIADAIKEMNVLLNEGGEKTREAFTAIGLNFDQIAASVSTGDAAWSDYFNKIVEGINSIEDPMQRSQAQIAIFGTMAEDLGPSFTEGLSSALTSLDQMAGATDSLNVKYNNFGTMLEVIRRQAMVALAPLGDALLDLGNNLMPMATAALTSLGSFLEGITPKIQTASTAFLLFANQAIAPMQDAFAEMSGTIGPMVAQAFDGLKVIISSVIPTSQQVAAVLTSIPQAVNSAFQSFNVGPTLEAFSTTLQSVLPSAQQVAAVLSAIPGVVNSAFQNLNFAAITEMPKTLEALTSSFAPAIENIRQFSAAFVEGAGPILGQFFMELQQVALEVAPVLQAAFAQIGEAIQRIQIAIIGNAGAVANTSTSYLSAETALAAFGAALDAVVIGVRAVTVVIHGIAQAFSALASVVEAVSGGIQGFVNGLNSIKVPSALTAISNKIGEIGSKLPLIGGLIGQSPSPLAIGLATAAAEARKFPDLSRSLGVDKFPGMPQLAIGQTTGTSGQNQAIQQPQQPQAPNIFNLVLSDGTPLATWISGQQGQARQQRATMGGRARL